MLNDIKRLSQTASTAAITKKEGGRKLEGESMRKSVELTIYDSIIHTEIDFIKLTGNIGITLVQTLFSYFHSK